MSYMMTEEELVEILKSVDVPVHYGESDVVNSSVMPRIAYWDYVWEDKMASGDDYYEVDTYQVSFIADQPRHPKLLELRQKLRDVGIHPMIEHEYVEEKGKDRKYYHSYFSVEIVAGGYDE